MGFEAARSGPLRRMSGGDLTPAGDDHAVGEVDFGSHPHPYRPESGISLRLLEGARIVRKWKWLIGGLGLLFTTIGGIQAALKAPLFTSALRLQIDRTSAKPVESGAVTSGETADSDFLRTQFELLQTRALAERVVSAMRLGDDANFLKPREASLPSFILNPVSSFQAPDLSGVDLATRERWAVGVVMANRSIKSGSGSRLFDIVYADTDPARAARIATGIADAFIESNIDKRFQSNAYAKAFLEDQTKGLKARLEETENEMLAFAEREQIVDVSDRASTAETSINAANAALAQLTTERIKAEELWKQVDGTEGLNLPQFLTNGVIDKLRQGRNQLATDYQEKLQTFLPIYPAMVQIRNKLAETDRQINAEVRALRQSYRAAYDAAKNQEDATRVRTAQLRDELLDLQKRSVRYNLLKREVDTNRNLYNGLLQRYKEVDVASGIGANNVFVVDRASVPTVRSSPDITRWLLVSLALGLALGGAIAWLIERLDDTIKSADDVEALTGLSTLGLIPRIAAGTTIDAELADPRSALSESYRTLCTFLQLSTANGLPQTLLVTSAGPSEGKSVTALCVARHFATIGLKVLLIDGDLRNPSLHKKLALPGAIGLTNFLTAGGQPPKYMQPTGTDRLAFLATGPLPRNAVDVLNNPRLHSLLSVGSTVFDLIVIDGPPVVGLADAPLLATAVHATLFVSAAGEARRGEVRWAIQRLRMGRSRLAGCVLTKFDPREARYGYGYGHGYGHTSRYGGGREIAVAPLPQIGTLAS